MSETRGSRTASIVAVVLAAGLAACSSIGHQQFYALEPTRDLVLRNHALYRVARPGELKQIEEDLAWAGPTDLEFALQEMFKVVRYADGTTAMRSLPSLHGPELEATRELYDRVMELEGMLYFGAPIPEALEGQDLDAAYQDASKALIDAQRALLRRIAEATHHEPLDEQAGSVQLETILVSLSGAEGELDAGDIVLLQSDDARSSQKADVFTLTVSSPGSRPRRYHARSSDALPEGDLLRGQEWVELIITEDFTDGPTEEERAEVGDEYTYYASGKRVHASLTPTDAAIPYRLVSPGVRTANGEKIEPGLPFTIIANRLFLAEDGDELFPFDPGEIAVVVSVSEGGAETRSFLAAYHDDVSTPSFVPFWGAILYSTTSWSGEPITIKIQVFDLDEEENTTLSAVFESALGTAGALAPGLASTVGIAGAIADTLTTNNSDDEILRFELTFVHDTDDTATETLVPRSRSYLIISPVAGTIDPQRVEVTDQWELQPNDTETILGMFNPSKTRWSSTYSSSEFRPGPPSYITITASDSIVIPEALFAAREAALSERINLSDAVSGDPARARELFQASLDHFSSATVYAQRLPDLLGLIEQAQRGPLDWQGLAALGGKIETSKVLTNTDKVSLLRVAQTRIRDLAGADDWAAVIAACEAHIAAATALKQKLDGFRRQINELSRSASLDAANLERLQSLTADVLSDTALRDFEKEALFSYLAQRVDRASLGSFESWATLHQALPKLIADMKRSKSSP